MTSFRPSTKRLSLSRLGSRAGSETGSKARSKAAVAVAVVATLSLLGLGVNSVGAVGPTLPSKPATTKAASSGSSSSGSTKTTTKKATTKSTTKTTVKKSTAKSTPGFSLVSNPTRRRIGPGEGTKLQVDLRRASGFTGVVSISASGIPKGVELSFPKAIRQFAPVTITTDADMKQGTYRITFSGTSGSKKASTVFTLVVNDAYLTPGTDGEEETPANEEDTLPPVGGATTIAGAATPDAGSTTTSSTSTTSTTTAGLVRSLGSTTLAGPASATTLAPGDFTTTFATSRVVLPVGGAAAVNVNIVSTGGLTPNPVVVVSGLPAGVTSSVGANSGGAFRVGLNAAATQSAGSFTLTATATEGGRVKTATTEVVITSDMGIWLNPSSLNAVPGGSAQTTITVSNIATFTAPVALSIAGLPAGVSPTVGAQSLNNTSTALTLSVAANVAPGTYPFTISGTGGGVSKAANGTLTVAVAVAPTTTVAPSVGVATTVLGATTVVAGNNAELTLTVVPQSASIPANGGVMRYTITVTGTLLATTPATITVGGLPANTTSSITPNPTTSTASLTITSALPATFGAFPITISATTGTQTRTQSVSLTLT